MYYTIISKTPLINKNLSRDEKMFRTLVVGSICYVITHAILFSPKFSNQMIEKYRNYIYYVWGADLSIAFVMTKFMGSDVIPIDMNINSYDESDTEHNNQNSDNQRFQLETNGEKLTRNEIMERFYRQKAQNNINHENQDKSPFIKTKKEPTPNQQNSQNSQNLQNLPQVKQEEKIENPKEENKQVQKEEINKQIDISTEEKVSEVNISDTEIKTYKGKNNQISKQNISLSA